MINFHTHNNRNALVSKLCRLIVDTIQNALSTRGRAVLSLPGGSTPAPLFIALSQHPINWHNVFIVLNDERWVKTSNARSNTRLVRDTLMRNYAQSAQFKGLFMPNHIDPATASINATVDMLNQDIQTCLPIDCLVLGMGADGHIASLFPHDTRLSHYADLQPVITARAPQSVAKNEQRLTLSPRVLINALHTHIMITGNEKRNVLERAEHLPKHTDSYCQAPVKLVLPKAQVHWTHNTETHA